MSALKHGFFRAGFTPFLSVFWLGTSKLNVSVLIPSGVIRMRRVAFFSHYFRVIWYEKKRNDEKPLIAR